MKANNVFTDTVQMDTQTVFHTNGSISIYPCPYELGQQIVAGDFRASQKGRMTTEDNGTSRFMPYLDRGHRRYDLLFATRHGTVKESRRCVVFTVSFPKTYGKALIGRLLPEEFGQMEAYVKRLATEDDLWGPASPQLPQEEGAGL